MTNITVGGTAFRRAIIVAMSAIAMSSTTIGAETAPTDPTSAEAGQQIFETIGCSSCHGTKGEGITAPKLVGSLTVSKVDTLLKRILYGGGDMPPFNNLTDEQVAAVANFVRSKINNYSAGVTAEDVTKAR
ncbi:c-type cytochrome [Paradevosia shaoguanensis]|uniref:Cytochrome c n=1 Tax=Paradevosia shaoguanensis TaxID=1335043 RepID=A0AA41QML7_9HYPH|nr:cytochrome c [Paradevosia shaoguanensis]MCF1742755.1 cytochrome c [Paradevosia shaoguanensis]MCI0127238.1 cytochrome c [Paradevosia shaoguanensis]